MKLKQSFALWILLFLLLNSNLFANDYAPPLVPLGEPISKLDGLETFLPQIRHLNSDHLDKICSEITRNPRQTELRPPDRHHTFLLGPPPSNMDELLGLLPKGKKVAVINLIHSEDPPSTFGSQYNSSIGVPYVRPNYIPQELKNYLTLQDFRTQDKRNIFFIHLKNWKDQKAFESPRLLLILMYYLQKNELLPSHEEFYREDTEKEPYQTYIHCLAGLGRTGTFVIAFEIFLKIQKEKMQGRDPKKLQPNITAMINNLRQKRPGSVATKDQVRFLVNFAVYAAESYSR